MTESDQIKRAEQANWLLNDPTLQEMFSELEEKTIAAWRVSKDRDFREEAWKMIQAIALVRTELKVIADNGRIMADRLERREKLANAT